MVQISDKNSNSFCNIRSGRVTKILPSSSPFSKDEGLRDTGNSISIGNLILGANSVTVSYLIHYDSLLQNVADIITKCVSYFITKCDSIITNWDSYYKLRQFCHKVRQLLQNATFITICDSKWLHVYGGRLIGR